jgi:hypothetical protein
MRCEIELVLGGRNGQRYERERVRKSLDKEATVFLHITSDLRWPYILTTYPITAEARPLVPGVPDSTWQDIDDENTPFLFAYCNSS